MTDTNMTDNEFVEVFEVTPHPDPVWDSCICLTRKNALAMAQESFTYWMELADEPVDDCAVRIRALRVRRSEIPEDAA